MADQDFDANSSLVEVKPDVSPSISSLLGPAPGIPATEQTIFCDELSLRWKHWLTEGLEPAERDHLMGIHYRQGPCSLEALLLNSELSAFPKSVKVRGEHLIAIQNGLGSAIAAFGAAFSYILESGFGNTEDPEDENELVTCLSDAGKLLADTFFQVSVSRRELLLPKVEDPTIREILQKAPIDSTLFGTELQERVEKTKKEAQASKALLVAAPRPKPHFRPTGTRNALGLLPRKPRRQQAASSNERHPTYHPHRSSRHQPFQRSNHNLPDRRPTSKYNKTGGRR